MNRLVSSFENEIRIKIRQKADSYKQEEMLLLRTFKFFDYHSEGLVEFSQFQKVMTRLSITMLNTEELRQVFSFYTSIDESSTSKYGGFNTQPKLNYNIFVNRVLGLTRGKSAEKSTRTKTASVYPETRLPMGQEEDTNMISSHQFERALDDLRNGVKRMDMMYILNKIHKRLDLIPGTRELDQREIQQELMENGLARRHQVMGFCLLIEG
jgi:hypothetical protein